MIVRVVRHFTTASPAGTALEQRVEILLEFATVPRPGDHIAIPGVEEPLAVERTVHLPSPPGTWKAGFRSAQVVVDTVDEPPERMAAAFSAGGRTV